MASTSDMHRVTAVVCMTAFVITAAVAYSFYADAREATIRLERTQAELQQVQAALERLERERTQHISELNDRGDSLPDESISETRLSQQPGLGDDSNPNTVTK